MPLWEVIKKTASMSYKRVRELRTQYRLKKEQGQFPDSPNPAERDIIVEAEELFHEGKLKQAEEAYITIIEHNQKNIEAYEGLAEVYLKMKDFEHAEEILSYIVKLKEQFLPEDSNSKEKSEIYSCTISLLLKQTNPPPLDAWGRVVVVRTFYVGSILKLVSSICA